MRRGVVVLVVVASSLVVIAGAVFALALTVGPLVYTRVATASERVGIDDGAHRATLEVSTGWAVRQTPWDAADLTLISPDGAMEVGLRFSADPSAGARALRDAGAGDLGPASQERIGAVDVVHARTVDRRAVVGLASEGGAAVLFVSTADTAYDAELARLLSTVRVTGEGRGA